MPLFYSAGIVREHENTRANAGLFDISHMVLVEIDGADSAALISRLCPYPATQQPVGHSRYSFFLNENAGIIDDLIVTRRGETRFLIVCNAGCAEKDLAHIRRHATGFDVTVEVLDRVFLALQGPAAENVLENAGLTVANLSFLQVTEPRQGWVVARSGYTGEDGFEIAIPSGQAEEFAAKLLEDDRVLPAGLGARDSLRLEAGLPLYGQDLAEDISPQEAGIAWAIPKSHREGGDFIGAPALAAKFAAGRKRKRVGLKPVGNAPVRAHAKLANGAGDPVGEVTSGGFGPTVGHPVALGLIDANHEGSLFADLRGRQVEMEIVKLPFVEHRYRR
jgi:aminomethyltransferase